MAVERTGQLVLDPRRQAGFFARRQTERARRAWFQSGEEDDERLWNDYRRREMGARAEEAAGRFLQLLDGWEGAKIFHAVEFRGADLPHGDVDHLVLFEHLQFAFVVESKYRLGEQVEKTHLAQVRRCAEAVGEILGVAAWPVLCQSLPALRDDIHYESVGRRWTREGDALLCDAEYLPRAIQEIVGDLDAFQSGAWSFPEQRPHPQPTPVMPRTAPPAPALTPDATPPPAPPPIPYSGPWARKLALGLWWVPGFCVMPFGSWLIAALLTHSKRYALLALVYAVLFIAIVVTGSLIVVCIYWLVGLLHVAKQGKDVQIQAHARAQRTALTAGS